MTSTQLLGYAQRLQAIAQAGIAYHRNQYDFERYQELRALSAKMLEEPTSHSRRLSACLPRKPDIRRRKLMCGR